MQRINRFARACLAVSLTTVLTIGLAVPSASQPPGWAREARRQGTASAAEVVLRWNLAALDAIRAERTPPPLAARNLAALYPHWVAVTPYCLNRCDQFRPPAPPALNTPAYTAAFREVKALGAVNSTTRTADQTQVALFWADGDGTSTPPGHWNHIARDL